MTLSDIILMTCLMRRWTRRTLLLRLPALAFDGLWGGGDETAKRWLIHYIILDNGILKSNSTIFPRSEGYITQYTLAQKEYIGEGTGNELISLV